jgi:hypothetical protein
MPVITLTSDWQSNDYYLATVKGRLLSAREDLRIIDLNHSIGAFNIREASFVLRNSYHHFPPGSIHLVFVNNQPTEEHPYLAIYAEGHYFIGTGTGIFSLFLKEESAEIFRLKPIESEQFMSFPGLITFTDAALKISMGKPLKEIGDPFPEYRTGIPIRPTIDDDIVTGRVIYTDSYGNVITNISRDLFERIGRNRLFQIMVQSKKYSIERIDKDYSGSRCI